MVYHLYMLEARIEDEVDKQAITRGGFTRKWGMNGEPDRLIFLPDGKVALLECKKPGGSAEPTALQARNLQVYRGMGFMADWVASFSQVETFFARLDSR